MPETTLANYHTHTTRCHHAEGTEEEYIQTALHGGYHVLGFSDHTPWCYRTPGFTSRIRMLPKELDGYVQTLQALKEKYKDQLHLHIGLEVEYFPDYLDWLSEESARLSIEYWILGCHYDTTDENRDSSNFLCFAYPESSADIRRYAEQVEAAMETGKYLYLAHPDLCLNHHNHFGPEEEAALREICTAAVKHNMPLEYNLAGLLCSHDRTDGTLGYTTDVFWEIAADYPVRAILGCDAHAPAELDLVPLLREKQAWLRSLGIQVLDTLPGLV